MTLTTLVSVPLLALVVSSLPILPDSELMSAEMQDSAQIVFRLRSSHPDNLHRDARIDTELMSAAANNGYLSFDTVHRPTIAGGLVPPDQQTMSVISSGDEVPITHNFLDLVTKYGKADFLASVSTLFLIFSCAIALLAVACAGLRLYATKRLHTQILWSHKAWQSLPHVEKHAVLSSCRRNPDTGPAIAVTQSILNEKSKDLPYFSARASALLSHVSITTTKDLQEDSEDEKFHDALDVLPSLSVQDLPSPDSPSRDLSLPPVATALDPTPDDRSTPPQACVHLAIDPEAREPPACLPWSVRVASSTPAPPSPLIHPRSRAYRAVPEFDIALAMQLRPGRGVGADQAWMVRFLMAIFGWFAVALTGNQ